MNSWMGAFFFLIVGVGSKQFRSVITGSVIKKVFDKSEASKCTISNLLDIFFNSIVL